MRKRFRHKLEHEFRIFVLKHFAPIPEEKSTREHHEMVEKQHRKNE